MTGPAWAAACDVRRIDQLRAFVQQAVETFGRIDRLVNNAGINAIKPSVELTETEWDKVLPIDLDTATFFIGHATVVADHAGQLSIIPEAIFAYLKRNAVREELRYGLPADQVMEIGEQISI